MLMYVLVHQFFTWGAWGRKFESSRPDHKNQRLRPIFGLAFFLCVSFYPCICPCEIMGLFAIIWHGLKQLIPAGDSFAA